MIYNKILLILFININGIKNFYLFTVIISIFNTGRYLNETIGSLLNQTIGFNLIQLILINDGSTDNTENICLKFQQLYNKNIIYVKIPHGGVSKARNIGLNYVKGLYINFLDSDDKWDFHAFENVNLFFKFYKNVDIVSGRMKYFESLDKYHFLDYKFRKTRIVNLNEEYSYIQLSSSSSFFRWSSIKKIKFEEGILFGEDIRFITNIILIKPIIGIIKEAIYYYRKRSDSTSALQNSEQNNLYYFNSIINVQQYIINKSISLYNKILPFIQYFVAYELIFRLRTKAYKFLDSINYKKYCELIENTLKQIEDKYFLEQKIFPSKLLIFALSKKYNRDLRNEIVLKNESFIYSNYILINLKRYKNIIVWRIMSISGDILHLEGEDRCWFPSENFFYFSLLGNKTYFPKYYYYSGYDFFSMYGIINKGRVITFDIKLDDKFNQSLKFFISYMDAIIEIFPSFDSFTKIPPIKYSYYSNKKYIISNEDNNLIIHPYNDHLEKIFELNYCKQLKKLKKDDIIKLRKDHIESKNNNKDKKFNFWLINDRLDQAGDNGEYFFRYLTKLKPKGIKFYFVINKNSSDYSRLKIYKNIINFNSSDYLKLFLKADKILSSVCENWVYNPFGENGRYIKDLYHFDLIYLQNGIIKDDLSNYLNKISTNFNLIITSSIKEYRNFLNYNYGYNKDNILLTGLSRFDNLRSLQKQIKPEKIILIMPTWRIYIKGTRDLITHESIQSEYFRNSSYFYFYNNLINNKELNAFLKNNDFKGIFCIHHNFAAQWKYFNQNNIFDLSTNCNKQEFLLKSSLLITDYSSIFFDFGYLEKPIIYTHFDYEEYRANQFSRSYFYYEKDGFGPICCTINCTINTIISMIENKCKLKKLYKMRIRKFFTFFDQYNCFRTFNEITKDNKTNNYSFTIFYYNIFFIILKTILNKKFFIIKI